MPRDPNRPGPANVRLRALLTTASALAQERELAGEETAVAAFHSRLAEADASHGPVRGRPKPRIALASLAVGVCGGATLSYEQVR
jgi:hypothetical protein